MGAYSMRLHDVGEGVAEAEIVEWRVAIGDVVGEDDVVAEVMSDKATIELYAPVAGTVTWLAGDVGDSVPVGAELVRFDLTDDAAGDGDAPAEPAITASPPAPVAPPVAPASAPTTAPVAAAAPAPAPAPAGAKASAAPAVRARATALGIDLGGVVGSGPDGRIVHADLDALMTAAPAMRRQGSTATAATTSSGDGGADIEQVKIVGLRRNIAERMQAAKRRIPHFTYVDEVDVTELERLRARLNVDDQERPRLTILPFLMRAVVTAAQQHPEMNARFDDEAGVVSRYRAVHLGIAVQTARGLMVPVVKSAGDHDLWSSAAEVSRLSDAARSGKVTLDELTGSTITITSLGALGGIVSTPVINAPEVAIVGVNKIATRPVYFDGALVPRQIMNLSSSFDHRVIDGADAAAFIQTIRRLLETPALLWVA